MKEKLVFLIVLASFIVDASKSRTNKFDQISIHYFKGETIIDVASYIIKLNSKMIIFEIFLSSIFKDNFIITSIIIECNQ